jgi:putative ATP-binding cassette transporter
MTLLRELWRYAPRTLLGALLLGLCSGALNTLLIVLLQHAGRAESFLGQSPGANLARMFVVLALLQVALAYASALVIALIPHGFVVGMRREILARLLVVPLKTIETLGYGNILSSITDEIALVYHGALGVPQAVMSACIVCGAMVYIASRSSLAFAIIAAVVVIAVAAYILMNLRFRVRMATFRQNNGVLFTEIGVVLSAAKELRINSRRRQVFLEQYLWPRLDRSRSFERVNLRHGQALGSIVSTLSWTALGSLLFVAPLYGAHGTGDIAMILLFLVGPLTQGVTAANAVQRGAVALESLKKLEDSVRIDQSSVSALPSILFEDRITLQGIEHRYRTEETTTEFRLGPINLEIRRGELLFLIGGNGSGKSTLAKLIVGLYDPERGQLSVDGVAIAPAQRQAYSELFSAIFTDFHLFDWVPDSAPALDEIAQKLLVDFRLDGVVRFENGRFSTTSLSTGQRKRLALIVAYLEDRPFYVLDEWAADQDPSFKRVFYEVALPALRARGKTCLVITHDDRYFHLADRVIRIDSGQLVGHDDPVS